MAVTGTPTTGNDTLTGDGDDDTIIGLQGNDIISGGGGADVIYGDVVYAENLQLDSNQGDGSWSAGVVDGWSNTGSGGTIERWGDGFLGLSTNDGGSFIELDGNTAGLDFITTDVDLEMGVEYVLTFDAAARAGSSVNDSFEVVVNGDVIATIQPTTTTSFTTYSFTITGVTGLDEIGFRELVGEDNSLGILLDDIHISLSQTSVDTSGHSFNDIIDGGEGNDVIYGQEGDDRITGGIGDDVMDGGIGNDTFVLEDGSGNDVITDFVIGEDDLDVAGLNDDTGNPVRVWDVTVTDDMMGGSILTFVNGETVRLSGVDITELDTDAELNAIGIPCFTAGTLVSTIRGQVAVEDLLEDDQLVTCGDDLGSTATKPLRRAFRRDVGPAELAMSSKLYPVRITAGALGNGLPARDLLVSRQHRMLVRSKIAARMFGAEEVLIPAIKLTALPGIFVDDTVTQVSYFHLLFDDHEVIFAEGAPTESLFTGPEALKALSPAARDEIMTLFPQVTALDYAPTSARVIPGNQQQKQLVARHLKNSKACLAGL